MARKMSLKVGLALFAVLLTSVVMQPAAHAVQYVLNLSGCDSPGCGAAPYGTVDLTQNGTDKVDVKLTLFNSERVINTGVGDHDTVFAFNLGPNPATVSITGTPTTGFALVSGAGGAPTDVHFDGFGHFEYGLSCTDAVCGNGGGAGFAGPVSFTLTGSGLTEASFAELSTGGGLAGFFAVDIIRPSTTGTGAVGGSTLVPVPEPGTLVLVGTMLVGLGVWGRRRVRCLRPIAS